MKTEFVSLSKDELITDQNWWSIYQGCFPDNERESKEVILKSIEEKVGNAYAVKINNKTIGIATTQLLLDPSCIFLIYLGLDPRHRGLGIGPRFLTYIQEQGIHQFKTKGLKCKGLIWEVEKPDFHLSEKENSNRLKRINFFKDLGGKILDTPYIQPPVDGKNLVDMNLMYLPSSDSSLSEPIFTKSLIQSIYFEKYFKINTIDSEILFELLKRLG